MLFESTPTAQNSLSNHTKLTFPSVSIAFKSIYPTANLFISSRWSSTILV